MQLINGNTWSKGTVALSILSVLIFSGCTSAPKTSSPTPPSAASSHERSDESSGPVEIGAENVYIDELSTATSDKSSSSFAEKVDRAHDALFMTLQETIANVDGRFVPENAEKERVPVSKFRLGLYAKVVEEERVEYKFDPEFDIEMKTPNIERRLSLILTTEELDELPGTDPTERDQGLRLGVRYELPAGFKADAGIKWTWLPDPYAQIGWGMRWRTAKWKFYPGLEGYWRLEDGLGSSVAFTCDRWFGRGLFRSSTGARLTEHSDEVEWSQTFVLGYARELIDESKIGERASGRDLAHGGGFRYRITGETETGVSQTHEGLLFLKRPLRKKWAYFVLALGATFRNERDWEAEPSVQVGLDMLFWDVGDR